MNDLCRILLVEDDTRLATLVRDYLNQHGMRVTVERRGDRAVARILSERPDLVVLDLMLPGLDGFGVCRAVRPTYGGPVLMLTASDEDADQVAGLETGADDYVVKPVAPRVLLARIRGLLRRAEANHPPPHAPTNTPALSFGALHIALETRSVRLHDQSIELTTGEFDLLWLLASHAGSVLSRDDILAASRGITYDGLDRSVDARISRLRRKLGDDPEHPRRIKTVWRRGYLFSPDGWE